MQNVKLNAKSLADELIKNEGDPFVRNAYISMREKAKRGAGQWQRKRQIREDS